MEIIRHATPADAPVIVQFIMEEAREAEALALDQSIVEKGVGNALAGAVPRYWVVIDEQDQNIIASASIYTEWSDWNNANYWWLQSFYLVPAARGRGVAQRLMQQIAAEATEAGAIELRLYVHKDNPRATAAYIKAGFDAAPYEILTRKLPGNPG
jgi:GNAT superfamily N-acetyltransferase